MGETSETTKTKETSETRKTRGDKPRQRVQSADGLHLHPPVKWKEVALSQSHPTNQLYQLTNQTCNTSFCNIAIIIVYQTNSQRSLLTICERTVQCVKLTESFQPVEKRNSSKSRSAILKVNFTTTGVVVSSSVRPLFWKRGDISEGTRRPEGVTGVHRSRESNVRKQLLQDF